MRIKSPPRSALNAMRETLHDWSEKEIQHAGLLLLIREVAFKYVRGYQCRATARVAAREAARIMPGVKFVVRRNEFSGYPWRVEAK